MGPSHDSTTLAVPVESDWYAQGMAKFLLRFGGAAHPVVYSNSASAAINDYRIDAGRSYPVMRYVNDRMGGALGSAKVTGAPGAFYAEPEFEPQGFDWNDCTLWAFWDVDDDGVANLDEVLLTVKVS